MSSHFSESRDSSYVSLAMYPEFSRKDWRIESVKLQYTHWKAAKRSSKDQVEWLQLQPCLVPSWCGASRTIWDCCWSRGIWGPPRTAAQRLSPKEMLARKWVNEQVCRPILNPSIMKLSSVFVCQKWMSISNNSAYLDGNLRFVKIT